MPDLFGASRTAIEHGSPVAYGLALLFGMLSSVGPCGVTRLVIVSSIARSTGRSPLVVVTAFLVGLVAVYVTFAFAIHLVWMVQLIQTQIIAIAAVAFGVTGIVIFVKAYRHDEGDHSDTHVAATPQSIVGVLGVGALSALNFSPCCAPWLIMALTYSSMQGSVAYGALLMVAFALGHAVPILAFGRLARQAMGIIERLQAGKLIPLVNSALMLFLAVYYGVQV